MLAGSEMKSRGREDSGQDSNMKWQLLRDQLLPLILDVFFRIH